MAYLVDTNVLLRCVQPGHPMHASAVNSIQTLRHRRQSLFITTQNIFEFWVVVTRPLQDNGLGMTTAEANAEVERLEKFFPLIPDILSVYGYWRQLVTEYNVVGVQSHDARLVASMQVFAIEHILTFNIKDFKRYGMITTVHPSEIL